MRLRSISATLATLLLAGCLQSTPAPSSTTVYHELLPGEIAAVQAGVAAVMRDPASAQFGQKFFAKRNQGYDTIAVCGLVNGRNAFGGYTGLKPFTGVLLPATFPGNNGVARFRVEMIGGTELETQATIAQCNREGLPLGY